MPNKRKSEADFKTKEYGPEGSSKKLRRSEETIVLVSDSVEKKDRLEKQDGNMIVVESSAEMWKRSVGDIKLSASEESNCINRQEEFESYLEDLFF
jgi:hypothetical protein